MEPADAVDLVVFSVRGTRFAADLTQVRRVDVPLAAESVGPALGHCERGRRALVFELEDGVERRLEVDEVHGVVRPPVASLRRLPTAARGARFSIGAWLDGDETVVLVDLHAMHQP
jgi:chemotaxis signal transduction protein